MAASRPDAEVAMPGSRRDALQSVLLIVALVAGLVAVRWSVTGGLSRPMAPPAPAPAPRDPDPVRTVTVPVPSGTRLSLGGRQPVIVDPASGEVSRIPSDPRKPTSLFRQGGHTVLVSNERAWAVPAGRAGPRRPLGRALAVLPALAQDRVWLVTRQYGAPDEQYALVEVGLDDGRALTRWTLPYRAAPVTVLSSGVLARDFEDDLVVVEPGSGRVRAVLGRAATFIDARAGRVAWVAGYHLHIRHLATGVETVVPPPPGSPSWHALGGDVAPVGCCYGLGAFSPDGQRLAVYARLAGPGTPGLAVVDVARGRARLLPGSQGATPTGCLPCLAWSSSGRLFYFAAGSASTSIGAWSPGEGLVGLLSLPLDADSTGGSAPNALAAN
jgi:hypothetical protein